MFGRRDRPTRIARGVALDHGRVPIGTVETPMEYDLDPSRGTTAPGQSMFRTPGRRTSSPKSRWISSTSSRPDARRPTAQGRLDSPRWRSQDCSNGSNASRPSLEVMRTNPTRHAELAFSDRHPPTQPPHLHRRGTSGRESLRQSVRFRRRCRRAATPRMTTRRVVGECSNISVTGAE